MKRINLWAEHLHRSLVRLSTSCTVEATLNFCTATPWSASSCLLWYSCNDKWRLPTSLLYKIWQVKESVKDWRCGAVLNQKLTPWSYRDWTITAPSISGIKILEFMACQNLLIHPSHEPPSSRTNFFQFDKCIPWLWLYNRPQRNALLSLLCVLSNFASLPMWRQYTNLQRSAVEQIPRRCWIQDQGSRRWKCIEHIDIIHVVAIDC